jgi:hypothetical protein
MPRNKPPPTGAVAGYTAPLDRWTGTAITGIGTGSALLEGYFSQTYRPEHHNFDENFIFDPHLEAGLDSSVVAEWDARGIRAIIPRVGFGQQPLLALTTDGRIIDGDALPE